MTQSPPSRFLEAVKTPNAGQLALAGILAWLVPGAGHIYIGLRVRGIIFMAVIAATFWTGVAIGGVRYTVDPSEKTAWFAAQICSGSHAIAATVFTKAEKTRTPWAVASPAFNSSETGVVYTGVAGLLNLLVVIDVLARGDAASRAHEAAPAPSPPNR